VDATGLLIDRFGGHRYDDRYPGRGTVAHDVRDVTIAELVQKDCVKMTDRVRALARGPSREVTDCRPVSPLSALLRGAVAAGGEGQRPEGADFRPA
jgi:hypothetical protein